MARCPFAVWRPLPENATQGRIDPDQVILHSAVDAPGPTSLYGYFGQDDIRVESHFFVKLDGAIEQYMDTNVRADANLESNWRAVSIETEDEGNPNQRPWTPAQLDSIKRLLSWVFQTHPKVLKRVCPDASSAGLGWHSMWGTGPTPWIPYSSRGKTCPGTIRIQQIRTDIIPWMHGEEVDMTPEQDQLLRRIAVSTVPFYQDAQTGDGRFQVQTLVKRAINADELAEAIASRLAGGSVDAAVVKTAVKEALREGTA